MNYKAWSRPARLALVALTTLAMAAYAAGDQPPDKLEQQQTGNAAKREAPGRQRAAADTSAKVRKYIVQLAERPAAAYDGNVEGYKATRPQRGKKLDADDLDVARYSDFLRSRQDKVMASAGVLQAAHRYTKVFNGFAADLDDAQVARLAMSKDVLSVSLDEKRAIDTSSTPAFLGLNGKKGVWEEFDVKGEDVVVGIVDSGIWPEHPSFANNERHEYKRLRGWKGTCITGEDFNRRDCNGKIVGARYFNSAWGGDAGIDANLPWEFNSPRDFNGHGTHVASTSAGNSRTSITGQAAVLGRISGMAPRARIAVYKVCWQTDPNDSASGSCFNSDSVAAIEQAVADGVDVINFSVSGSQTSFRDPVEIAFLFAADAGVFVATSAGNSGPTASTVAHGGPWVTTVAAGTHSREGVGSVALGNGVSFSGASFAAAAVSAPMIAAEDAGLAGADPTALRLCFGASDGGATLDPAKVAGKIVVCDRGVSARVNKSLAVLEAGGVGMVLVNTSPNSLNADFHAVPSVHVADTGRAAILAYAKTAGASGTVSQSQVVDTAPAPFTASFSSRGPLRAGGGNLLKPDIIAPGQDIVAGVAPPANFDELFAVYSGTSMSSPHVAGLAALMKEKHPDWSPASIKSAMMTTAGDVLDGPNTSATVIFRQGAGHVQPARMFEPGLVYDSGFADWLAFICGAEPGGGCGGVTPIHPSNLNVPSIAIGAVAGVQKVVRTLTNVTRRTISVAPSVAGMVGFDVQVSPAVLVVPPGESRSFEVTFTRTDAPLNAYTGGQLTWSNERYSVRSPIVARPVALAAPATVSSNGGPVAYDIGFGYSGSFSATARGLVAPTVTPAVVAQDPDQTFDPADPTGTFAAQVTIPAGTTYARFATFDADVNPGADIDMYVYLGASLVGASTTGTSGEEVNFAFANPTAGPIVLTVYLHGWGTAGPATPFKLHEWYVGATATGNMTVGAPAAATLGASGNVSLSFSDLAPATRYLGSVVYGGEAGATAPTLVRVDTP